MKIYKSAIIFLLSFIFTENAAFSQVSGSTYSIFGIGQIENIGFGANRAMGNSGIALKSKFSLNNLNPASFSGIDTLTFLFDAGATYKCTNYENRSASTNKNDASIDYLAFGFRISRHWAVSAGLIPYSRMNYTINVEKEIIGKPATYTQTFTGKGGINQFYFANSITPIKNLSFGINLSYLFGEISQTELVQGSLFDSYKIEKTNTIHSLFIDYGLQYKLQTEKYEYLIGAVFNTQKDLDVTSHNYLITISDTTNIKQDKSWYKMPQKIGIGLAIVKERRMTLAMDYEMKKFSSLSFSNPNLKTRDSEKISIGGEYRSKKFNKGFFQRLTYRGGLNLQKTYLIIDGSKINQQAITLGAGIPMRQGLNMVNLSFEFGQIGTTDNSLVLEKYGLLHLNISLHEIWFRRRQYN